MFDSNDSFENLADSFKVSYRASLRTKYPAERLSGGFTGSRRLVSGGRDLIDALNKLFAKDQEAFRRARITDFPHPKELSADIANIECAITLDSLSDWETSQTHQRRKESAKFLRRLIMSLNPSYISRVMGREILLWAFVGIDEKRPQDFMLTNRYSKIRDSIREMGYKPSRLLSCAASLVDAHSSVQDQINRRFRGDVRLALKAYDLCSRLKKTSNLPRIASKHLRRTDIAKLNSYSLRAVMLGKSSFSSGITYSCGKVHPFGLIPESRIGEKVSTFYLDAPHGIALVFNGEPIAAASAYVEDNKTLTLYQLQGVNPKICKIKYPGTRAEILEEVQKFTPWELEPIQWRDLLIEAFEVNAKALGFTRMGIAGAENIRWTQPFKGEEPAHMTVEQAAEKYDKQAELRGFIKEQNNNWYRNIS